MIDEDMAHDLGSNREELSAVVPSLIPATQANVCFMHQRGGLKSVSGAFPPQVPGRALPQLRIDEREELISRGYVPSAPRPEQFGYG
jgi:hypothetical protein